MNTSEAGIFQTHSGDLHKAFVELYTLYAKDVYVYAYAGLFHHVRLAEQVVHDTFFQAYKYFHTFTAGQVSFRSYLFSLAVPQVVQWRSELNEEHKDKVRFRNRKLTEAEQQMYLALQNLDPATFSIIELWQGEQLTPDEIALAVRFDVGEVRRRYAEQHSYFQQQIPAFEELLRGFYQKRAKLWRFTNGQERRILEKIIRSRRKAPSFVRRSIWSVIMGPIPLSFAIVVGLLTLGVLWYTNQPAPLYPTETANIPPPNVVEPSAPQRPREILTQGQLPNVKISRSSLIAAEDTLYGTDWVVQRDVETDNETELRPTIQMNVPVNEYRPITEMYVYSIPEALSEEDLQLMAYEHFATLPLNQFTFVNGTYYIEESDQEFRPLFIALNNDGSIEFQMRQAAICQVEGLTDTISETDAQKVAFDFLHAHNFVYVDQPELKVERISDENRTITKDAFCKNGDQTAIQDREFVFYPPHTVVRYGEAAEALVPMRLRGIAVQVQGNTVTNVRIDPLQNLDTKLVQSEVVELIPLEQAVEAVREFYYPASADQGEAQRFRRVFTQWFHQHGDRRLQDITINQVRLEYVFDPLNRVVEPYYVFFGTGIDATGEDDAVRIYVAASVKDVELRGPYRE